MVVLVKEYVCLHLGQADLDGREHTEVGEGGYTPARRVAAVMGCRSGKAVSKLKLKFRTPPSSKLKFKGGFELLSTSLSRWYA